MRAALALAISPPLIGLVLVAGVLADAAVDQASAASDVRSLSREEAALSALQADLSVERYWANAILALDAFGLDVSDVEGLVGVDVAERYLQAQGVVDESRAAVGTGYLDRELEAARDAVTGGSAATLRARYGRAVHAVDTAAAATQEQLQFTALEVRDPAAIERSIETLDTAVRARAQVYDVVTSLFATRFPSQGGGEDAPLELVNASESSAQVWSELVALAEPGSEMEKVLDSIGEDPQVDAFLAEVERTTESVMDPDGAPAARPGLDLDGEAASFTNSLAALERFVDLVGAAGSDVSASGDQLVRDARRDLVRVVVPVGLLVLLSFGLTALLGRWIVRSLKGVSSMAAAMDDGDMARSAVVRGLAEVRVAARTLNDAAGHLSLAEQQALALANDDLTAPVLAEVVPGRLGVSLQAALRRLATEMAAREELRRTLHHEANHDALTGLFNRSAVTREVQLALGRTVGSPHQVAVLFIDLDEFKRINDHHGHDVGDKVLQSIAGRIAGSTRVEDSVGRLGGDEFIVVAELAGGPEEANELAERIRTAVAEPIHMDSLAVTPRVSIGIALGDGDSCTAESLIQDADLAVYQVKRRDGGDAVAICGPELRAESTRRREVEDALADAIRRDELVLHYQPVVSASDHQVVSCEALVRWPGAGGDLRLPGRFIPVAERSDLIVRLDDWVIRAAADELGRWRGDPDLDQMRMAVNISARHASTTPFAATFRDEIGRAGADASRLVVELTESALLDNLDHVIEQLEQLRALGATVVLDDFGTGYTSLSLLHRLPVDGLKLDRLLVRTIGEPRVRAIVQLIVDTSHLLGLRVIAEGIETERDADIMTAIGVDALQGFHFARPCPVDELRSTVEAFARPAAVRPG